MRIAQPLNPVVSRRVAKSGHPLGNLGALAAFIVLVCAATLAKPSCAEPTDDYLAALRTKGWHDVVLDYLDWAEHDPLATPAFLEKVSYERALTQIELAKQTASEQQRDSLIEEAVAGLMQFAKQSKVPKLRLEALATAGNLLSDQATLIIARAEQLPATATSERRPLLTTARQYLEQATAPLQDLLKLCEEQIELLPKAAELQRDAEALALRQLVLAKQAEAKFLLAKLQFETARTFQAESNERQKAFGDASAAFADVYSQYEDKLVGFFARLYQGRSLQEAGKLDEALDCYWDIVDQPPIPNQDFRRLVTRAYRYRAECHQQAGELDKAIEECRQWLDESNGPEFSEPDWLALSYQLATLYDAKAAESNGADAQRLRTDARKLYREVAAAPGEFQRQAKAKMTVSGNREGDQPVDVDTFAEALAAGKKAIEQMNSSKMAAQFAADNNPDAVDSLGEQAASHQTAAMQYFRQATQLADKQTATEDLVSVHYFLCWLLWEQGKLEDAAVVGQYVAQRHPESKFAPLAAKLALASYERLYNAAQQTGDTTDFEAEQLANVAKMLAVRWPDSPEAAAGVNLLINVALRDDRLSDAEQLLQQLPPESRAAAELRLGSTLWTRYLQASSNPAGPSEAALALKARAAELLAAGFESLQSTPMPTTTEAAGVLYYCSLLLADGEAEQTIAVLENVTVGPLSLVRRQAAAASEPAFVQETYKVALRAYLSIEPPQREQAQAMMTALEATIGQQDDAEQRLIAIYVSLGLQLQQQINSLSAAGQTEKANAVARSFEDLLNRVTERAGAANDWKVQSWIAQTNLQIGQGLSGDEAARYYQQATDAYKGLLKSAEADANFAPSPLAVTAVRKRLADCLLAQQNYAEAMQLYLAILRKKPNMLELQQAAAEALQQWGKLEGDTQKLDEAIRGTMPQADRKNLVWGWLRLASIVDQAARRAERLAKDDPAQARRAEKYRDLFFEARYRVAEARFEAAKNSQGAQRQEQLGKASQSLESMQRLYPDLGGPRWKGAYLDLLKQMEQMQ